MHELLASFIKSFFLCGQNHFKQLQPGGISVATQEVVRGGCDSVVWGPSKLPWVRTCSARRAHTRCPWDFIPPQTCLQKVSQGPWTNHSFTHHWVNHSCTTSPSESMAGKVNHPWGADVPKPKILSCPYPAYNDFNWRLCVCPLELTVCGGHRWLKLSLKLSLAK